MIPELGIFWSRQQLICMDLASAHCHHPGHGSICTKELIVIMRFQLLYPEVAQLIVGTACKYSAFIDEQQCLWYRYHLYNLWVAQWWSW